MKRAGFTVAAATLRSRGRVVAVAALAQLVAACVVPGHMHVTQGVAPKNIDTNVRFRTTYYFRVFDYCWATNAPVSEGKTYRNVVPETDTLYRYRMTGKASALGNSIKFESGVLSEQEIAPFGADVAYNSDINGFVYRSREDAKREAEAAVEARSQAAARSAAIAASEAALDRFEALAKMFDQATKAGKTDEANVLKAAMAEALQQFTGTLRAPMSDEFRQAFKDLNTKLAAIDTKLPAPAPAPAGAAPGENELDKARKAFAEEVKTQLAALREYLAAELINVKLASGVCPAGEIRKKGFQIMGPEGMRPYNQDSRLVMAMFSSAKPLIETLDEYSGRMLKGRANPAEQLLPLARETTVIVQTQRALDGVALKLADEGDARPKVADVFSAAATAFDPEGR